VGGRGFIIKYTAGYCFVDIFGALRQKYPQNNTKLR
jgi:hypothetical protein